MSSDAGLDGFGEVIRVGLLVEAFVGLVSG